MSNVHELLIMLTKKPWLALVSVRDGLEYHSLQLVAL